MGSGMPEKQMLLAQHDRTNACILCGEASSDIVSTIPDVLGHVDVFHIMKCRSCGLMTTSPTLSSDQLSRYYSEDYSSWHLNKIRSRGLTGVLRKISLANHYGYAFYGSSFIRFLLSFPAYFYKVNLAVPQAHALGRLLDVGCGSGDFIVEMADHGWSVEGVEPSAFGCEIARKRWGISPFHGTIENFPGTDYDVISLRGVIEHLPEPIDALIKLKTKLKPGGRLFLTTHDISGLAPILFKTKWVGWEVPNHLFFFDKKTIHSLFKKAGYQNIRISSIVRTTDLFNTLTPNRFQRLVTLVVWPIISGLGFAGGMVVEATH